MTIENALKTTHNFISNKTVDEAQLKGAVATLLLQFAEDQKYIDKLNEDMIIGENQKSVGKAVNYH